MPESERAPGPTYRALGLIRRPTRFCSRMCADQPATRAQANIAGVSLAGICATSRTTAAQYSTFVGSSRSGWRRLSSARAASSSAFAVSTRGEPSSAAVPVRSVARGSSAR